MTRLPPDPAFPEFPDVGNDDAEYAHGARSARVFLHAAQTLSQHPTEESPMLHSPPEPFDPKRFSAHAELFDKLSTLRTMLCMLHSGGFEHFRSLDEAKQAEYLWKCMEYAEGAYSAMLASDGLTDGA